MLTAYPGRLTPYVLDDSGSPELKALADSIGALAATRGLSLLEMLAVTGLIYSMSRRLFNERAALCAAVVYAVTEPALFLGHLATYDATALLLLTVAAWLMLRFADHARPLYLLAALVLVLAVATKYATLLFVPSVIALAGLAAVPRLGRRTVVIWGRSPRPPSRCCMTCASNLFEAWPNSSVFVADLARYVCPGDRYLVEVDEVPIYYLRDNPGAQPRQFSNTYYIGYTNRQGQYLTGNAGYAAAIQAGYFNVIAFNYQTTPGVDAVLAKTLAADPDYSLADVIPNGDDTVRQYIWVKTGG